MAIHYNLAKVFERANSEPLLVRNQVEHFITKVPIAVKNLVRNIKNKEYRIALDGAKKIKPTLELMGMTIAYDEITLVENWAVKQGKRREIGATIESIKNQIEKASKEMNKEFKIFDTLKTIKL